MSAGAFMEPNLASRSGGDWAPVFAAPPARIPKRPCTDPQFKSLFRPREGISHEASPDGGFASNRGSGSLFSTWVGWEIGIFLYPLQLCHGS